MLKACHNLNIYIYWNVNSWIFTMQSKSANTFILKKQVINISWFFSVFVWLYLENQKAIRFLQLNTSFKILGLLTQFLFVSTTFLGHPTPPPPPPTFPWCFPWLWVVLLSIIQFFSKATLSLQVRSALLNDTSNISWSMLSRSQSCY